jgi:hypothetical protein
MTVGGETPQSTGKPRPEKKEPPGVQRTEKKQ